MHDPLMKQQSILYVIWFCVAVVLATVVGPQTLPWTWGPCLVALGLSVWMPGRAAGGGRLRIWLWLPLVMAAGWLLGRAWCSPVREFGVSDALLVLAMLVAFGVGLRFRADAGRGASLVLAGCFVCLVVASAVVVAVQLRHPEFTPLFRWRQPGLPSGFLGHYNEFSNVMLAVGFCLLSVAVWGGLRGWMRGVLVVVFLVDVMCIYLSRSRGGWLGAGAGMCVFSYAALMEAKRRGSRWFAAGVVGLPFVLVAAGWLVVVGLQDAQSVRKWDTSMQKLLGDGRLYAYGLAAECVGEHPLAGGGSHSFSWESRHHTDIKDAPWEEADIVYVHNELCQAVTDYGVIGAGWIALVLACVLGRGLWDLVVDGGPRVSRAADAWLPGALAAAVGVLVQSNFSFVFHNPATVVLFGFFLGLLAGGGAEAPPEPGSRVAVLGRAGLGLAGLALVIAGAQATRALWSVWPAEYAKGGGRDPVIAARQLQEAAACWPHSELRKLQARWLWRAAAAVQDPARRKFLEEADAAWREARRLHPLDPVLVVNHANNLSHLHQDSEALAAYDLAIRLQGGYEAGVRAFYHKGLHLSGMAAARQAAAKLPEALDCLVLANDCFRKVREHSGWHYAADFPAEQVQALTATASIQLELDHETAAEASLREAAGLPGGSSAHFALSTLLRDRARRDWYDRRPGVALTGFRQAWQELVASDGYTPPDAGQAARRKLEQDLRASIRFLEGAQVRPE